MWSGANETHLAGLRAYSRTIRKRRCTVCLELLATRAALNLWGWNEVSMEHRRNVTAGETGDPRVDLPTSSIVRHDSRIQTTESRLKMDDVVHPGKFINGIWLPGLSPHKLLFECLDYLPPTKAEEQGSISSGVTPGQSHVGIVLDDTADWRVLPAISCIPDLAFRLLHTHLVSPSSALKTSMLTATQVSLLTHPKFYHGATSVGLLAVVIDPGRVYKVARHACYKQGVLPGAAPARAIFTCRAGISEARKYRRLQHVHDGLPSALHLRAEPRRDDRASREAMLTPTKAASSEAANLLTNKIITVGFSITAEEH
ncbi:hypothetical protein PR048_005712 [Dryococelus australis]|uniref:Uncharacterized protein n=1 Tax=Dryococelus australis TaxID=614101 RepID=A0ABQ9I8Y4_9NEOP|nr:hypothetical protein PR048_005712 [Dryococelus australis]